MKTITLTIGERIAAVGLLNDPQAGFPVSTLTFVIEDVKKLVMNEEDWKNANLVKTPTDEEVASMTPEEKKEKSQVWKWDESTKEVEINKETADALIGLITKKSDASELKLSDGAIITLKAKLEA